MRLGRKNRLGGGKQITWLEPLVCGGFFYTYHSSESIDDWYGSVKKNNGAEQKGAARSAAPF